MEEICTFAKRGWLVKDSKEETVPNLDLLTSSFSGLKGGAEAVKKCMKVKEEAESLDDYYYYDYDYLEEGEGMEIRRKREAGKNSEKKGRKASRQSRRQTKRTNKKPNKPKRPNKPNKPNKKGNRNNKKRGNKNKGPGRRRNN